MYDSSLLIIYLISFLASVLGAVCGIGGGVIIKPVLDSFQLMDAGTVSFLSGCTVLSMTCYSVVSVHVKGDSRIDYKVSTYLGIGAAAGGCLGKCLFEALNRWFSDAGRIGAVQSAALFVLTIGTLCYTLQKHRIHTRHITGKSICACIGIILGIMSSFLGIGGGPINLVLLYFCFSMETKVAVQNSLYIILISQVSSLIFTAVKGNLPAVRPALLLGMVIFGILGGAAGRRVNSKIDSHTVNKLFIAVMLIIILICVYNFVQYM
ncbi:sulfite exporter TauE/SafE family protein [Lactonifactor longoviformis]|uniref:Probable membrane transporter protein n=2 Tax=Lactonifactor TaxID=420345 RepID=A0A1M5BA39_9CLOT|nr:sulfite exporter TauE/SafE family protein [Lactonifactor longoviformis]POP33738.1 sulfite exporter TauE/SafE family protein [Lactonifactor longoviformis]SHF39285.1 hypothetical protein SAMN02745158_03560 [Lactonifactor longoviformis DSM 17459]